MNKTNIFNDVMNYIDDNITKNNAELKNGIRDNFNYNHVDFNTFLSILTDKKLTLISYIKNRRLYFAAKELVVNSDRPIVDIALEYCYSEQSAFTRAMRKYCGHTPDEIRKNRIKLSNNKLDFSDFFEDNDEPGNRLRNIIKHFMRDNDLLGNDDDYFLNFIDATNEYGFDTDTCCAISEVSERLKIPFGKLLDLCFETMIDIRSDPDYLDPEIEMIIDYGLSSEEQLNDICEYYNCKYYQLNELVIEQYIKQTTKSN